MYEKTNRDIFMTIKSLKKLENIHCDFRKLKSFMKQHNIIAIWMKPKTTPSKNWDGLSEKLHGQPEPARLPLKCKLKIIPPVRFKEMKSFSNALFWPSLSANRTLPLHPTGDLDHRFFYHPVSVCEPLIILIPQSDYQL